MKKVVLLGLFLSLILMLCVSGCGSKKSGPVVKFRENFESYNLQSSWTSLNWTDYNSGNATIWELVSDSGNKVLRHTQYGGLRVYNKYTGNDYTVSAKIKPGNLNTCAGIVARFIDNTHYYSLTLDIFGFLTLRKFPQIGDNPSTSFAFNTSTYYTLTLKVKGNLITGTVTDGVTTATVTLNDDGYDANPSNSSGQIGVSEFGQTGSCFDDIKVTEP